MYPYPTDEQYCPDLLFRFEFESCSDINAIVFRAKTFNDALGLFSAILGESRLEFVTSIQRID